ncbi:MAG: hypothetical protein LIP23_00080, partial [Planctomycetes bacterium]|nr:hypothetical protein [Planctomycetota bacterium]
MNNHITDPLAYLYEEMTPDQMEQARQHLAVCPECKKQTAAILETVKTYRRAPRPAVPAGLADRAASAALRQASRPEPVEAGKEPAAAQQEAVVLEMPGKPDQDELEYINQSMPARLGWREWFFHPAWTVAAGVIFVCAILIHLSPRQNHWFTQSPVEYYPIETRTVSTSMAEPPARRLSDRLPAPLERHQSQAVAPEPQPPAVAVAEAYGIPSVSASPVSPPVEATVQASAIVASPPAAIPEPVPASSAPALSAPAPAVQAPRQAPTRTRTVEDAPLVQQRRPASREADRIGTESADSVGAVDHAGPAPKQPTSVASLFAGAARRPSSAGAAGQDEKVSAGSSFSAPPQPMPTEKTVVVEPLPVPAAAVAGGEPEAELARADVVATDAGDAEPAPPSAGSFDSNSAPPFAASQSAEYA